MGVLEAETASPLLLLMLTLFSTSPKLVEPTVAEAPLELETPEANLIVVPVKAPFPRAPVVKSLVKLRPPHSPGVGLQGALARMLGHTCRPTLLSRRLVSVAPPRVASRTAPWKLIPPKVLSTAPGGRVRVLGVAPVPGSTARPFTMA